MSSAGADLVVLLVGVCHVLRKLLLVLRFHLLHLYQDKACQKLFRKSQLPHKSVNVSGVGFGLLFFFINLQPLQKGSTTNYAPFALDSPNPHTPNPRPSTQNPETLNSQAPVTPWTLDLNP